MRRLSFAFTAVAFFLAGLSTGQEIYYFLGLATVSLVLFHALGALWTVSTAGVEISGLKSRVERGDALMTIFSVRHKSLLPVAAVRLWISTPSGSADGQEINVTAPPFVERTFRYRVPCAHRGVYRVGIVATGAEDLLGMVSLRRKAKEGLLQIEVLPKAYRVEPLLPKSVDIGPEVRSHRDEDSNSPSDVRKWQDGDVLKKVHWKLSLRKREIMVRTFEESARPDTIILPDLCPVQALGDRALYLEDCVCEAALSAAMAQLDAGYPVRMPLLSRSPLEVSGQFSQDLPLFSEALLKATFDSPYSFEQVILQMQSRMQRIGGMILITPRFTSRVADMAQRLQHTGVQVKLIWVTDGARDEALEMMERLRMDNVIVERIDPARGLSAAGKGIA